MQSVTNLEQRSAGVVAPGVPVPESDAAGSRPLAAAQDLKCCSRCGERKPIDEYYFVSRKTGTRRGQCKPCILEIKAMQKDPNWKPACSCCGKEMHRFGPGRRLCQGCWRERYDAEARRSDGSHLVPLKDCPSCGVERLRADHEPGTMLCPVCRSVPQGRRKSLRTLYNVNPREFLALLEDQGHCCWICQRPFTKQRVPHVDHQHKAPRIVRGLLCAACNTLIAIAKDDSYRLAAAAKYVEAPPAQYVVPGRVAHQEANRKKDGYRPLRRNQR